MEHLIYSPHARSFRNEVRAAVREPLEVVDWQQQDEAYGPCPSVTPAVAWLGHDHVSSSCCRQEQAQPSTPDERFERYGIEWDFDAAIKAGDIFLVHPTFKARDLAEATLTLECVAFMQSWLYLGVLEAITGRPIEPSYFVRRDTHGKKWLYSRKLPVLLTTTLTEADYRKQQLAGTRECAITASLALRNCLEDLAKQDGHDWCRELRRLLLSIEPAISALHEALTQWAEFHSCNEIKYHHSIVSTGAHQLNARVVARGWCPSVVASVERSMSPSVLRHIDALAFTAPNSGHHRCTRQRCERNHIRRETYVPQHCPRKCRCRTIKPDLATILDIIDAGYYPVVLFDDDSDTIDAGGIHPDDTKAAYIAFSHVWADGLGSSTEAGLPLCQVRRLHFLAKSRLATGGAFWIDALCIPRQEPHRHKAIELMKATYQNAQGVIVFDEQLTSISVKDTPLKVAWFVFASGWFGRLWTYQEGFLPPWVDFVLSDGFMDFSTLVRNLYDLWNNNSGNKFPATTVRELFAVLQKARPVRTKERVRTHHKKLIDLFNTLSRRNSSRLDDQVLVICLLLDISIAPLLDLQDMAKWRALYLGLGTIPWTIVFDRRPKIDLKPFCWAPASWLSSGQDEWLHYNDSDATIRSTGLHISLIVLRLCGPISLPFEGVLYIDVEDVLYRVNGLGSNHATGLRLFDMIIVRHCEEDHPEHTLLANRHVHMRVGLALLTSCGREDLQYNFHDGFTICLVPKNDPMSSEVHERLAGFWDHVDLCFT